ELHLGQSRPVGGLDLEGNPESAALVVDDLGTARPLGGGRRLSDRRRPARSAPHGQGQPQPPARQALSKPPPRPAIPPESAPRPASRLAALVSSGPAPRLPTSV